MQRSFCKSDFSLRAYRRENQSDIPAPQAPAI